MEKKLKICFNDSTQKLHRRIGYNYYNLLFKENNVITNKSRYGGYLHLNMNKIDSLINANNFKNDTNNNENVHLPEINIHYLHKMLELCKQNEIEVYLIRSPIHEIIPVLKKKII